MNSKKTAARYLSPKQIVKFHFDKLFSEFVKNTSLLLSGNLCAALFGLISIALAARALGPESYGLLVLIQAYVLIVDSLVNFQSWQAIIKFGTDLLQKEKYEAFVDLIKFGTLLDAGTALLGAIIAVLGTLGLKRYFEWGDATTSLCMLYCVAIAFNINGTPTAVLRLFDRFGMLAFQKALTALIRMLVVLYLFLRDGTLSDFLTGWLITEIAGYMLLIGLGVRALKAKTTAWQMSPALFWFRLRTKPPAGILRFLITTNLTGSVKLAGRELDLMIVGVAGGLHMTGLYKIVKQFVKILSQIADPIEQALYPQFAKLWAARDRKSLKSMMMKTGILTGALGGLGLLAFLLFGPLFIELTVGQAYRTVYWPTAISLSGFLFFMVGISFRSTLLSMGFAQNVLVIHLLGYTLSLSILPVLVERFGLIGASAAQGLFHIVWFGSMLVNIKVEMGKEPCPAAI